jgi:hypothetical protein
MPQAIFCRKRWRAPSKSAPILPDAGEMDSCSVRVAIERDALTQALSLQEELQTLVHTVKHLKQGVAHVSNIAHEIARVSHQKIESSDKILLELRSFDFFHPRIWWP